MKGMNTEDFVDQLMDTDGCVRHKSFVYHFSGLRRHAGRGTWRVSVEKYRWTKEPFEDFMELVYSYESGDPEDCMDHLLVLQPRCRKRLQPGQQLRQPWPALCSWALLPHGWP